MDNYLESSQLFQQLPFSFILMGTNDFICFQQLEQNFRFGLKLPDMVRIYKFNYWVIADKLRFFYRDISHNLRANRVSTYSIAHIY